MSILPTEANLWLVVRKKHIATGWGPYTMDSGTTVSSFRIWKWWNRNSIPWPRRTICVLILALLLCDLRSISLMPFWASGVFFEKTSPLRMYACWVTQLCPTLCNSMDCSPPGSSAHGDSPGKNIRVDCHALLQGIFPTQELNPGLLHCRQILYCLSHQGNPLSYLPNPTDCHSQKFYTGEIYLLDEPLQGQTSNDIKRCGKRNSLIFHSLFGTSCCVSWDSLMECYTV